jgi:AraC-like DNA-binding protein
MTARLLDHLGRPRDEAVERSNGGLASDLRDLLDERRLERITLAEAGRILHASPAHLLRCFSRTFGIAPHRYLVARRVEAARWRLLEGEPVAQVAAAVGFYDQAHLTRHFKRHVGTTPAQYASREGAVRHTEAVAPANMADSGCSWSVGGPCQSGGRGFESRRPPGASGPPLHDPAGWPSGQAAACKAAYTGSIPVPASRIIPMRGA